MNSRIEPRTPRPRSPSPSPPRSGGEGRGEVVLRAQGAQHVRRSAFGVRCSMFPGSWGGGRTSLKSIVSPSMNSPILTSLLQDNPIVVTGMGAYSAAGDPWSLMARRDGRPEPRSMARVFRRWPSAPTLRRLQRAALDASAPALHSARKADRCAQMALHAANQAWNQAALVARTRLSAWESSSVPRADRSEKWRNHSSDSTAAMVLPTLSAQSSMGSLSGTLAQCFGLKGPGAVISATCASAAFAIGFAAEQILLGKADAMLVGGAEAPFARCRPRAITSLRRARLA